MKEGDWVQWFDENHERHTGRVTGAWKELEVREDETKITSLIYENQAQLLEVCNETIKIGGNTYRCENLNTRYHTHEAHINAKTNISWKK